MAGSGVNIEVRQNGLSVDRDVKQSLTRGREVNLREFQIDAVGPVGNGKSVREIPVTLALIERVVRRRGDRGGRTGGGTSAEILVSGVIDP